MGEPQEVCPVCHEQRDIEGLCYCSEGTSVTETTTLAPEAQVNYQDEHPELNVQEG